MSRLVGFSSDFAGLDRFSDSGLCEEEGLVTTHTYPLPL